MFTMVTIWGALLTAKFDPSYPHQSQQPSGLCGTTLAIAWG